MTDVISGGPSGQPRRPPAWLVVVVSALLCAAAADYLAVRTGHPAPGAAPSVPTVVPAPQADAGGEFSEPPLAAGTGLRLLLDGPGLRIVDVERGTTRPVPPLAQLNAKLEFVPVRGGDAFAVSPCGSAECRDIFVVPVGGDRAVLLTNGTNVAAAADGTDLWVTTTDSNGRSVVREVGVDGRLLSPGYPIPGDWSVFWGTTAGLLTVLTDPSGARAGQLWDPIGGRTGSRFDTLVAVGSDVVAWLGPGCVRVSCPLRLTDLRSGHISMVPVPAGAVIDRGAFSPDGGRLAVSIAAGGTGPATLGVIDVAAGRLVSVAGATATAGGLAFAWSRDSAWLALLAQSQSAGSAIAVWHVGERVVHPIPGPADAWSLALV